MRLTYEVPSLGSVIGSSRLWEMPVLTILMNERLHMIWWVTSSTVARPSRPAG